MEKERDEAKREAKVARLAATTASDAKARVEDDLANALDALAATEEDCNDPHQIIQVCNTFDQV